MYYEDGSRVALNDSLQLKNVFINGDGRMAYYEYKQDRLRNLKPSQISYVLCQKDCVGK